MLAFPLLVSLCRLFRVVWRSVNAMVVAPYRPSVSERRHLIPLSSSGAKKADNSAVKLCAGSVVPLLENTLWVVNKGMVKFTAVTEHGDALLLGFAGPEEPFGASLSKVQAYEAITLTDCELTCQSLDQIAGSAELATSMVRAVSSRVRQSEFLLALLGLRRVDDRVRCFLELMAQDYGTVCKSGIRIGVRLTHQDIASALSTTRVTVTRVIGQLKDQGWLEIDSRRHLVVLNDRTV